eukprot:7324674-Lingulodinium_polyedra.AAC.1
MLLSHRDGACHTASGLCLATAVQRSKNAHPTTTSTFNGLRGGFGITVACAWNSSALQRVFVALMTPMLWYCSTNVPR